MEPRMQGSIYSVFMNALFSVSKAGIQGTSESFTPRIDKRMNWLFYSAGALIPNRIHLRVKRKSGPILERRLAILSTGERKLGFLRTKVRREGDLILKEYSLRNDISIVSPFSRLPFSLPGRFSPLSRSLKVILWGHPCFLILFHSSGVYSAGQLCLRR